MDERLKNIYYDLANPGSFSSVEGLHRATGFPRNKIKRWLMTQPTYTLHKQVRKKYETRQTKVPNIDSQWQCDLVDMQNLKKENDNFSYILNAIDVLSRFGFSEKLKTKQGNEVADAFERMFSGGRVPSMIQTDEGKEFYNKRVQNTFKKYGINHFSTHSPFKCGIVERWNRSMKTWMYKAFTALNTSRWIDFLPNLVKSYNSRYHRTIGIEPENVSERNEHDIWLRLYAKKSRKKRKSKLVVGDLVRISKAKKVFDKGYIPSWTEEIFKVSKVFNKNPIYYRLIDYNNEEVRGIFYKEELQKIKKGNDIYIIDKILKTKGKGKNKKYFVSWKGYPISMNSWVDNIQNVSTRI